MSAEGFVIHKHRPPLHECGHLVLNHLDAGSIVDDDVTLDDVAPIEAAANEAADEWLFPGGFPNVESTAG